MTRPHLIVRPAFGPGVGGGHLGRCLAVVQAWIEQGGTASLAGDPPEPWARRYRDSGSEIVTPQPDDWPFADGVVHDGYAFESSDHVRAAQHAPLAILGDHGLGGPFDVASTIIDQNVGAREALYERAAPHALVLAGPRFALLRRETRDQLGAPCTEPPVTLAVAFGGDPNDATLRLLLDAARIADAGMELAVLEGVDDVGAFLATVDVVLSTAGTTVLDVLAMARPAVLVSCAANQRPVVEQCARAGVAVDGGDVNVTTARDLGALVRDLVADPVRRAELGRKAAALVDGRGAPRVAAHLRSTAVSLRAASMADTDLLLEWANDAEARRFAFTAGPIDHVTHVAWLRAKLADPTVLLFVAADRSGTPLGQVRFEITGSRAVISVSVAAPRRGEGWGAALVLAGVRALFASSAASDCSVVIAEIKDGNDRSARVFELADFELASEHEDGRGRWRSYARLRDA